RDSHRCWHRRPPVSDHSVMAERPQGQLRSGTLIQAGTPYPRQGGRGCRRDFPGGNGRLVRLLAEGIVRRQTPNKRVALDRGRHHGNSRHSVLAAGSASERCRSGNSWHFPDETLMARKKVCSDPQIALLVKRYLLLQQNAIAKRALETARKRVYRWRF